MSVTVSDDELRSAGMSADDFRREVALLLFQQERMTLAQAARFSGMNRLSFQRLIADRGMCVHYDVADFEQDLETLRELGRL
jgi:predicted HTH domain antitoxin